MACVSRRLLTGTRTGTKAAGTTRSMRCLLICSTLRGAAAELAGSVMAPAVDVARGEQRAREQDAGAHAGGGGDSGRFDWPVRVRHRAVAELAVRVFAPA